MADPMQQARDKFEAWASAKGMPIHRRDFPSSERRGEYGNAYTQDCWEAWQAAPLRAAPEGFVMVPVEPTEEMIEASLIRIPIAKRINPGQHLRIYGARAWEAMLAARPQGVSRG